MAGRILFEYRPPRSHPMIYALLLVSVVVWAMASLENLVRDNALEIYLLYGMPVAFLGLYFVVMDPSPTRIYEDGIAPSRPRILRWHRPFLPFDQVESIYPGFYDVTGAFVSPFASSDGKVTQMGLGVELVDGHVETIRFTPSRFTLWQPASSGYRQAVQAIDHALKGLGRPWVHHADPIPEHKRKAMLKEAGAPFLPFFAIVLLFASAAPILFILTRPFLGIPVPIALVLALIPPVGTSLMSYQKSRTRNRIMNTLSKSHQYVRERREQVQP